MCNVKYQYNQIEDVMPEHRMLVEAVSGLPIEEIDIHSVNEFLNIYFESFGDLFEELHE